MIISTLIKGLMMVFGYMYPAYECYKAVEKNKPEIEQLLFWCHYWILLAFLTVFERIGDAFVSWIPMYSEAKLVFVIYLWFPKTKGATYVYDAFFRPYVAKHESYIDRNLSELKTRAGDATVLTWQRTISYGQIRVFEILQYIASQSASPPRQTQPQQQIPRASPSTSAVNFQEPVRSWSENDNPPFPKSSTSLGHSQMDNTEVADPSNVAKTALPVSALSNSSNDTLSQNSSPSGTIEAGAARSEDPSPMDYEIIDFPPTEILMEDNETLSSLRKRLRMGRSAPVK
ncbi:hypothetical protein SAY87_003836 [Trapa incisa]|uniref:HVA22-like protein n=1 Tax=Trapa incisa TaxID=236973 RepID=A0AAN7QLI4_9MYRT|nr:hypothetical protein SAY87_003836 [Trapa incisa]